MFLRKSKQKLRSGAVIEHYQLAESVWERKNKRARTSIVYNFGRVDDPAVVERLRKLAKSILRRCALRRCAPEEIVSEMPGWRVVDAWPYGDVHALEALWKRLGLDKIITKHARRRKYSPASTRIPHQRQLESLTS